MAGPRLKILNALEPVQRFMQTLGNPEPKISHKFVEDVLNTIKVGDVLLSRENWRLTNPFVPGFWGHAAIYFGSFKVIEAIGKGVVEENLFRWLYQKDSVAILRPRTLSQDELELAARIAFAQKGLPYDYQFKPSAESFYCSELVTFAYGAATGNKFEFYPRETLGVKTVLPQDFWDAKRQFELLIFEINK